MSSAVPGNHGNAFDLLRVLAASAVLVSHGFEFVGRTQPQVFAGVTLGTVAVYVFFVVSGYLVGQSWTRDPHGWRFLWRRALRIFPGLIVVSLLTVLVVGPLASRHAAADYFSNIETWRFLWSSLSLSMSQTSLPGVFNDNLHADVVNGSLWSLPYEMVMYVLIVGLGTLASKTYGGWGMRWLVYGALVIFAAAGLVFLILGVQGLRWAPPVLWRLGYGFDLVQMADLGVFFFLGASLQFADRIVKYRLSLATALPLAVALLPVSIFQHIALWISVAYAALAFALCPPRLFAKFKGIDYSYGIYIYAFVVQQCLSAYGVPRGMSLLSMLFFSFCFTLTLAALSWHWVERPALAFKPKLRPTSHAAPSPNHVV